VTVLCQVFDLLAGPSPSRLNQFRTKTRILPGVVGRYPTKKIGRFKSVFRPEQAADAQINEMTTIVN